VGIITGIELSVVTIVLAQLISNVLIAPLQALAAPTMYFELLQLKGGVAAPATAGAVPAGGAPVAAPGGAPAATPPSTPPATPAPPSSEPPPPPPPPPAAS
jgi:hypothetical protein